MESFPLLFPLLILLLTGCDPNENVPTATTTSGSSSGTVSLANKNVTLTPAGWAFFVGDVGKQSNPNDYRQTMVTSSSGATSPFSGTGLGGVSSRSTSYTLGMTTSAIADTASYCYWGYGLYPPTNLRVGKTVTLKARVKVADVQGPGISLVIRGDQGTKTAVLFSTTQGKTPIRGTADFAEYSVTLPYNQAVDWCILYVVLLPSTTGTVAVTNVSLSID